MIKTSLLVVITLLASVAIGFALFTPASARGSANAAAAAGSAPAAPLNVSTDNTTRHDLVAAAPSFKITLSTASDLNGLFRDGETVFVPPTCKLDIRNLTDGATARFAPSASFGATKSKQTLDAPDHATFDLNADSGSDFVLNYGSSASLHVLVLYPAKKTVAKNGDISLKVNDTVLGTLKDPHKCGSKLVKEHVDCFVAPGYFARITDANREWEITPHMKLGQMVAPATRWVNNKKVFTNECHTEYFAPNRPLAEKLELVAEELERQGVHFAHWEVNSGYRTPAYNHSIGGATYSQHIWGDAVDVMIDEDHDHRMDDLNKDGKSDRNDGILFAKIADKLEMEGKVAKGGIGVYQFDSDESVGCHVHIDTRGYVVRWGQFGIGHSAKGFTWWPESSYSPTEAGGE